MKIINNAFVNRNGAYHISGGIIHSTQRIATNHLMEYWQQGNVETNLANKIEEFKDIKHTSNALYVGRIPTHLGHFILEGLPRLCDAPIINLPIIGYVTNGFLPEGILPTPINDIMWVVNSISSEVFYEIGENETYQVENLYVPQLPIHLSQSCSEPWRMSQMIKKIVTSSRLKHYNIEPFETLYLKRYEEQLLDENFKYKLSNPKSELSEQIATISYAKKIIGKSGSNTHMSIFANQKCLTQWEQRGDFQQTDRNQLICDLIKTFNNF